MLGGRHLTWVSRSSLISLYREATQFLFGAPPRQTVKKIFSTIVCLFAVTELPNSKNTAVKFIYRSTSDQHKRNSPRYPFTLSSAVLLAELLLYKPGQSDQDHWLMTQYTSRLLCIVCSMK